jgi:micrococcal nuclease
MPKKLSARKNILKWLGFLLLVPSVIFNFFFFQKYQSEKEKNLFLVINVLDGDTFVLEDKHKVRLSHLDAPALELCGGSESKKRLEELVENQKVSIERIATDDFGRSIAKVYLDDELINKILVAEGWAVYDSRETSELGQELMALQKQAKQEKLGIFNPQCYQSENLDNPKCHIKGNMREGQKTKIYSLPGCSNYDNIIIEKFNGDQWFCTEKQAQKAGFVKSGDCP